MCCRDYSSHAGYEANSPCILEKKGVFIWANWMQVMVTLSYLQSELELNPVVTMPCVLVWEWRSTRLWLCVTFKGRHSFGNETNSARKGHIDQKHDLVIRPF